MRFLVAWLCGIVCAMTEDWERLGRMLAESRRHLGWTQVQVADHLGVTRTPIQGIERGKIKRITPTIRQYARFLGWADGSIEAVLAGGNPTSVGSSETGPTSRPDSHPSGLKGLPLRVVAALEDDGQVLDSQVLNLSRPGSRTKLILVVKGSPDATPEEIREDLLAWEQEELRRREPSATDPESDEQGA